MRPRGSSNASVRCTTAGDAGQGDCSPIEIVAVGHISLAPGPAGHYSESAPSPAFVARSETLPDLFSTLRIRTNRSTNVTLYGGCMTPVRRSCFPQAVFANCPRLSIVLICLFLLVMGIAPTPLHSQTYTDLHDFNCSIEGCVPFYSGILAQGQDGNLYGTLHQGGTLGRGTVFQSTPAGASTTLYNSSAPDGAHPYGGFNLTTDCDFYGTSSASDADG